MLSNENIANPAVFGQRFFSQASLRILLSDRAADITDLPTVTAAAPVSLDGQLEYRSARRLRGGRRTARAWRIAYGPAGPPAAPVDGERHCRRWRAAHATRINRQRAATCRWLKWTESHRRRRTR